MKPIITTVVVLALAGCTGVRALAEFGSHPVPRAATGVKGLPTPTRQDVLAAGAPDGIVRKPDLTCFDYTLRKGEKSTPFYVVFNSLDKVTAYGYTSCATAATKGHF